MKLQLLEYIYIIMCVCVCVCACVCVCVCVWYQLLHDIVYFIHEFYIYIYIYIYIYNIDDSLYNSYILYVLDR